MQSSSGTEAPGQTRKYRHDRQARCCDKPLMAGGGLPIDATPAFAGLDSPVGWRRCAGAYALTAQILITISLADDDTAMHGHHIGIHRPSGSTGSSGIAATRPQEEGCMTMITRGFGGRRRDDTDLPPGQ
jgi:hypothetical protein